MSRLTLPNNQPIQGVDYEQLLQMMMVVQAKVDNIQEQTVNCSFLLEYLIEKLNKAAASGIPADLLVTADEFTAFYEAKKAQLRDEFKQAMERRLLEQTKQHELNLDD